MGDAMRAAGIGPEITVGERTYTFKPFGPLEIGRFEAWLENRARDVVRRWKPDMPPDEYDETMRTLIRDLTAEKYAWGSDTFAEASASLAGMKKAAEISLKAGTGNPPEVNAEFVEALFADRGQEMRDALVAIKWVTIIKREPAGETV